MKRRLALMISALAIGTLTQASPAMAAPACTDDASAGGFSVSCEMSGQCPQFGPYCQVFMTCTLTFTGVGSGSCEGAMSCGLLSTGPCFSSGNSFYVPPGNLWWAWCSGSGTSVTPVTLACSTS